MQIEVFRVSRKSSVLPVAVVLAGLALAGCEHPDGMALVAASATATVRTTPQPNAVPTTATTAPETTPSSSAATTSEAPPATTTTTTTTAEPPKQAQVPAP